MIAVYNWSQKGADSPRVFFFFFFSDTPRSAFFWTCHLYTIEHHTHLFSSSVCVWIDTIVSFSFWREKKQEIFFLSKEEDFFFLFTEFPPLPSYVCVYKVKKEEEKCRRAALIKGNGAVKGKSGKWLPALRLSSDALKIKGSRCLSAHRTDDLWAPHRRCAPKGISPRPLTKTPPPPPPPYFLFFSTETAFCASRWFRHPKKKNKESCLGDIIIIIWRKVIQHVIIYFYFVVFWGGGGLFDGLEIQSSQRFDINKFF